MRGHEEYKEMLAAHALSALDEAEARELAAHLESCAECRAELELWREMAAALAHVAPAVEPRAELRSQILNSIRAQSSVKSSSEVKAASDGVAHQAKEKSSAASNVVAFAKPARRAWSTAARMGALAASLVFIALVVSLILLWNRYRMIEQDAAQLRRQLTQTRGELTRQLNQTRSELARERETLTREQDAMRLMTAPDARMAMLAGTEMAANAHAKFVFDRQTGRAMLMAEGLPPAPAGMAYQLWYIAGGKAMPGHVFTPDATGRAAMHDEVPMEARNATIFAVTLEPQGGMPQPTGAKYLLSAAS